MKQHVHLYNAVNRPYGDVRSLLMHRSLALLEGAAEAGLTGAHETALDIEVGGVALAKEVHLDVKGFRDIPGRVPLGRVSIRWSPADHSSLFPVIEADLEAEPIDAERTMFSLLGLYQPPLGLVGAALDRLGFHRLAETALERFFRRLLRIIEESEVPGGDDVVFGLDEATRLTVSRSPQSR
ncbi:MAG: hypothetical protein KJN71_08640 [Acidimicrobiia bacterium]|nr:hypothetical protein [Acidimicrobiia bacterium]NNC73913.1 hypothetical protein [Acidimicrobiia bacterium]